MGHDLHVAPEVLAPPLLGQDEGIDFAGGHVVETVERGIEKALIGPEIEIAFRAIVEHKGFAVPVWVEGSGVEI